MATVYHSAGRPRDTSKSVYLGPGQHPAGSTRGGWQFGQSIKRFGQSITGSNYTPEEKELLGIAKQKIYGPTDPVATKALQTAIGRRYDQIRRTQGADITRRGLMQSTIGGNIMGQTYDAERQALAEAIANLRLQQEQLGFGLYGQVIASRNARMQARAQLYGDIASAAGTIIPFLI